MSRVFVDRKKIMPVAALSRNENNVSAYHVECRCGNMLGLLGQFRPDDEGRRIVRCDDLTPEQLLKQTREMGLVWTPSLSRNGRKGCGAITILGKTGQVLRVFETNSEQHAALSKALDAVRQKKDVEAAAAARREEESRLIK